MLDFTSSFEIPPKASEAATASVERDISATHKRSSRSKTIRGLMAVGMTAAALSSVATNDGHIGGGIRSVASGPWEGANNFVDRIQHPNQTSVHFDFENDAPGNGLCAPIEAGGMNSTRSALESQSGRELPDVNIDRIYGAIGDAAYLACISDGLRTSDDKIRDLTIYSGE